MIHSASREGRLNRTCGRTAAKCEGNATAAQRFLPGHLSAQSTLRVSDPPFPAPLDTSTSPFPEPIRIDSAHAQLEAELVLPPEPCGVVLFAHAIGNSHAAPRCHRLAHALHQAGIGTLLCNLLTRCEDASDVTHLVRFDIELLTRRLVGAIDWLREQPLTRELDFGLFGAGTGAAAALCASVERPECVRAVVCRSGRPDLAPATLARVNVPTLLIVGGWDDVVLQLNREALRRLAGEKRLEIVPRATGLFDEPGALDEVAQLAARWFAQRFHAVAIANPS